MHITKDNINQFIYGTTMDCYNMDITKIDFIPDGITHLYCYTNNLTSLPKLPDGLLELSCANNELTELPLLPENLEYLSCQYNNLPYPITINNFKEHNTLLKRKEILSKICA